jgi:hypothetical protein
MAVFPDDCSSEKQNNGVLICNIVDWVADCLPAIIVIPDSTLECHHSPYDIVLEAIL